MTRRWVGYDARTRESVHAMRKRGLPDEMALPGFEEIEAKNKEMGKELLDRIRAMEASPAYEGKTFPWTEMRKLYEQERAAGIEHEYVYTQSLHQPWKRPLQEGLTMWRAYSSGSYLEKQRAKNKAHVERRRLKRKD